MTQFTFNVPQNDGYTAVYLKAGLEDGWVDVFKNAPTGTPVHTFTGDSNNGTGMYIVDAGGLSNFLFVDQVWAANKPTATSGAPDDHGILVKASGTNATGGTLRVEAGSTDQYMTVTESTSTSNVVVVGDIIAERIGVSRAGVGVTNLMLRTFDFPGPGNTPATAYYPTFATFGGGTDVVVQNLVQGIFLTVDTGAAHYNRIWLGTNESFDNGRIHEEANVITGAGACIVYVRGTSGAGNVTPARIDFGPRSQVGDNRLEVLVNGVVTLAQITGNHTMVVEEVHMQSGYSDKPAVLFVEDPAEIDDLDQIEQAEATIEPTADGTEVGSWLVNATCTASVLGETTIGDFTIEGEVHFAGIEDDPPIVKQSTVNMFQVGTMNVTDSSGVVNVGAHARVTALTLSRIGALEIGTAGKFVLQAGTADLLTVASLYIFKGPGAADGVLDLTDNAILIDYTGNSPFADVRDYIVQGYNFTPTPLWIGDGINSSTAAAVATNQNNPYKTGIGYAEASALFSSFPATWEGQDNVDDTSVLVKYTFYGDANLDGRVNLQDFNRLAANFGLQSGAIWSQGDFNYDGIVNLQDFNRLAANFGQGTDASTYDDYTTEELEDMLPD